jgi:hypothetical protein
MENGPFESRQLSCTSRATRPGHGRRPRAEEELASSLQRPQRRKSRYSYVIQGGVGGVDLKKNGVEVWRSIWRRAAANGRRHGSAGAAHAGPGGRRENSTLESGRARPVHGAAPGLRPARPAMCSGARRRTRKEHCAHVWRLQAARPDRVDRRVCRAIGASRSDRRGSRWTTRTSHAGRKRGASAFARGQRVPSSAQPRPGEMRWCSGT